MLQNLDLDSVTFAQIASTGDPISIEDMNEQEMVDLIIVNLARLAVAGEWTGLLEAGGGVAGYGPALVEVFTGSTGALVYRIPAQSLGSLLANQNPGVGMFMFPFMGTDNAVIDAMQISAATTNGTTTLAGVYSTTTAGIPDTLLTQAAFTTDATGLITQTSLTGTFTMVKGVSYWLAWIVDHASQQYKCVRYSEMTPTSPFPNVQVEGDYTPAVLWDASVTTLPATPTMSGFEPRWAEVSASYPSAPLIGLRTS